MKTIKLLAAPLAALAAATGATIQASAQSIYRLDATTSSGVDLTSMSGYYADRMEGPLSADVYFSGPLTVDPAVSAANPFQLIGNGRTIRVNAAGSGFHAMPLKLYNATGKTGESRLMFTTAGATYGGGSVDVGQYNVLYFNFDPGYVNSETINVHNGGKIYGNSLCIGQNTQTAVAVSDNARIEGNYYIRLGGQSAATGSPVTAFMGITNATVTAGGTTPDNGKVFTLMFKSANYSENCRIVLGPGGVVSANCISHHGAGSSRIQFDGGTYKSNGNQPNVPLFHVYGETYDGKWPNPLMTVEGINGNPIDVEIAYARNLAGGQSGASRNVNLSGNGGFTKRGAGTLTFNKKSGSGSICDYTGPTTILGGGIVVADSAFKPGRGALSVAEVAFLDLNGFDAEFSGATGAGIVSNSAATVSTLTLGYGDADAAFTIAVGERINVVKTGTGTLAVSGAALSNTCDLTVSGGTVTLAGDTATYGIVTVESGATLDASASEFSCAKLVKHPGGTVLRKHNETVLFIR